jgi:hypothetical protein
LYFCAIKLILLRVEKVEQHRPFFSQPLYVAEETNILTISAERFDYIKLVSVEKIEQTRS